MLQLKERRSKGASMRLSANGRSLLINTPSWLGSQRDTIREVALNAICDYEYRQDQNLVLYTFETNQGIAEWRRVKKLKAIDLSDMDGTTRQLLLAKVKEMVRTNQQLGVRKQRWYYLSMPVSLDFG